MKLKRYIPIGIFLTALLIRILRASDLAPFTPDEEYLIYLANTIIKDFHIIWIGVSSLGFDFYMGPFWIYFISPFLMLSKGDPIILNYLSSLFGAGSVILLYCLTKKMFNTKTAIIASLTYALSPLIIFYDQKAYPTGISLLSLFLVASIYMTKYSKWYWVLFSILYGLVFHIHLSPFLIIFVAFYWLLSHRKTINKKVIVFSIIAFTVTVSPMIVFDYFHKGSNILTPVRIIKNIDKNGVPKTNLAPRFKAFFDSMGRVYYIPPQSEASNQILPTCSKNYAPFYISGTVVLIFILFLLKKKTWSNEKTRLIALSSLCFVIPFTILPVINPVEYYLLGFFPLLFIIVANFFEKFTLPLIILGVFALYSIFTATGNYGINAQKKLIEKVSQKIGNETFYLSESGNCHAYSGWRYLFKAYGATPTKTSEDYNFGWLYPDEISNTKTKYNIVMNEELDGNGFSATVSDGKLKEQIR